MLSAFLIIACLTTTSAWFVLRHEPRRSNPPDFAVRLVDEKLPQTQCRQCGYDGCLPYAEAVVQGLAPVDACPPGGQATARAIARLLGRAPAAPVHNRAVGLATVAIVEEDCIGCTKCIQVCPVDAIIGAATQMHTVITAECTGCGLCLPPCPVDCIEVISMQPLMQSDAIGPAVRRRDFGPTA